LRVLGNTPPIQPAPSALMEKLAKAGHLALYALMVVLPVLGWLLLSARGKPIPFFGLELPALVAPDKALGRQLKEIHELGGNLGYFLIGGHAIAALFHHYVLKDNTLRRMTGFMRQP
jgi:cytochrome b561